MKKWLDLGYDPGTLKHRELLMERLATHFPFKTLLDVGCASGPDLALVNILFPKVKCSGFDRTPEDVAKASKLKADVWVADLVTALPQIPDKSYDVVISNGVVMYHDPTLVGELMRIARKAVIMSERDPDKLLFQSAKESLEPNSYGSPAIRRIISTPIPAEVRDSWKGDGFIYEVCLN